MLAIPLHLPYGSHITSSEPFFERPGYAFIQNDQRTSRRSCYHRDKLFQLRRDLCGGSEHVLGEFQDRDRLVVRHAGEVVQELIKGESPDSR